MSEALPSIGSRQQFREAVLWSLQTAMAGAGRRIVCVDPTFADWPLDDEPMLRGLAGWLKRPQRRLVLLARRYEELPRCNPRFTRWRALWAHAVDTWVAPAEQTANLPVLMLSGPDICLHVHNSLRWQGRVDRSERLLQAWAADVDAVIQRSERGFPVNTLGL